MGRLEPLPGCFALCRSEALVDAGPEDLLVGGLKTQSYRNVLREGCHQLIGYEFRTALHKESPASREFAEHALPDGHGDLLGIEEAPGGVDLHEGFALVLGKGLVYLCVEVGLGHSVQGCGAVSAHGASPAAALGPTASVGAHDEHQGVDYLPARHVLLYPRCLELVGHSLSFHQLPHVRVR